MEATSDDSSTICDSDAYLSFLYRDSTRHIPHRPIVTIDDYPDFPEIVIDTNNIDISTNKIEISDPILIGNNVVIDEKDFVMEDITFETNSAILEPGAYPAIDEIISFLKEQPNYAIAITGHTDDVGASAFNLELSEARSQTVARLLLDAGIDSNRISSAGKGESEPLTENDTEQGRAKNRRVAFRFLIK